MNEHTKNEHTKLSKTENNELTEEQHSAIETVVTEFVKTYELYENAVAGKDKNEHWSKFAKLSEDLQILLNIHSANEATIRCLKSLLSKCNQHTQNKLNEFVNSWLNGIDFTTREGQKWAFRQGMLAVDAAKGKGFDVNYMKLGHTQFGRNGEITFLPATEIIDGFNLLRAGKEIPDTQNNTNREK